MASRGQYMLKIGGRLDGTFTKLDVETALGGLFDRHKVAQGKYFPDPNNSGAEWPDGFVLVGYEACQWDLLIDNPHPDQTMVTFRAEIHHTFPGSLFDNKKMMLEHVHWFYHYRRYRWWTDLQDKLKKANDSLKARFKQEPCLRERLWFRDWQWYCGNGGC